MATAAKIEIDLPKSVKPLTARDCATEGGLFGNKHFITIPAAIYPDCLTDIRYYVNLENKFVAYDRIEFRTIENLFMAEAVIAAVVQKRHIRIIEIWRKELNTEPTAEPSATGDWYSVFLGANRHWCVITPRGVIHREGLMTKATADHEVHVMSQHSPIQTMAGR
jgi:hypothetical protein